MKTRWTYRRAIVLAAAVSAVLYAPLMPAWAPIASAEAPSPVLPDMVTTETVTAIDKGLKYLARIQRNDGSWLNSGGYGSYPMVMTSLAGLALMAGGSTPESGPYAKNVAKAMNYVLNVGEANIEKVGDGEERTLIVGGGMEGRSMYGHGFSMLFLAECYGMESDKASERGKRMKRVLDAAVKLTVDAQSDVGAQFKHAGGWYYGPQGNDDEGSVTVTQLQALRACRNAGIEVPKECIDRAVLYLKYCQNADGGLSYRFQGRGQNSLPAISAAAIACFYSAGVYDRKTGGAGEEAQMVEALVQFVKNNVHPSQQSGGHWYYTHLYMAQAMYHRGGKDWNKYFPQVRQTLLNAQLPDGNWTGDNIGPVYGTAIATLILQLPYGYLPIMQR